MSHFAQQRKPQRTPNSTAATEPGVKVTHFRLVHDGQIRAQTSVRYGDLVIPGFRVVKSPQSGTEIFWPVCHTRNSGGYEYTAIPVSMAVKKAIDDAIFSAYETAILGEEGER